MTEVERIELVRVVRIGLMLVESREEDIVIVGIEDEMIVLKEVVIAFVDVFLPVKDSVVDTPEEVSEVCKEGVEREVLRVDRDVLVSWF